MISFVLRVLFIVVFACGCLMTTGCGSFGKKLKAFLGGKSEAPQQAQVKRKPTGTRFSQSPNYLMGPKRQYKRVTKKTLQNDSQLSSNSGSLWVMEGQGAYLFSENVVRMIGDPVPIRIEGDQKDQLQTKAGVIKTLLDRLEARAKARAALRSRQPATKAEGEKKEEKKEAKTANSNQNQKSASPDENFKIKSITARVVERTVDGNYRVKGSQPFMIGKREYKTIVTGIVRAEDFNEQGISSTKLMDPSFDIVGVRKREM